MQVMADRLMINQCFYHFKHLYRDMLKKKGGAAKGDSGKYSGPNFGNAPMDTSPVKGGGPSNPAANEEMTAEVQRLQLLVQQRDNEIGILLNYLNKKKGTGEDGPPVGIPV